MHPASRKEHGFTLVELMIVVLIIAVLAGIAIPSFLNTRTRSQDQAAKSNLRNALSSAQALYADLQDYSLVTPEALTDEEPSLQFQAAASDGPKVISVATAEDQIVLAAESASGKCWMIRHVSTPGTDASGTQQGSGSCDAAVITGVTFGDV